MWANTAPSGGFIAVGIEDKGAISGCHGLNQDQINAHQKAAYVYCSEAKAELKEVNVMAADGSQSFIMLFRVFYREDKVVFDSSQHAFMRIGDAKHKLSIEEIRELQIDKGQLDFEQETCTLKFPDDFNVSLISRFLDALKNVRKLDDKHDDVQLLEHRHLGRIKEGQFLANNACALLFAVSV